MLQCRLNSIRATLSNFAHSCQFSIIPQRQPLDLDFFAVEKWMSYCLHPVPYSSQEGYAWGGEGMGFRYHISIKLLSGAGEKISGFFLKLLTDLRKYFTDF